MKGLIIFLFIVSGFLGYAQNIHFIKTYGNSGYDYGRDVKQTLDTGYIATGSSSSFSTGTADAFLLKVDSLGDFKWSYSYGGLGSDWGEKVILTKDSAYALTGYTNSFGAGGFDFYLVKTDINGNPEWEKTYGGGDWDKAFSFVQMPDSGYVMVGETYSFGAGNKDGYIVRVDKFGDTLWTKTYGGVEDDFFKDVIIDGDSLVIVGGTKSWGNGMTDAIMLKTDFDFNLGWERIVGSADEDYFNVIDQYPGYYVAGGTSSYSGDLNKKDMWAYKISNTGTLIFSDVYWDSSQDEEINGLFIHPLNQDIYFGGYTKTWGYTSDGKGDIFLSKFGSSWFFVNSVHYGEKGADNSFGMDYCYDKGFITIGEFDFESTGGKSMVLIKYNFMFEHIDIFTELGSEVITLSNETYASTSDEGITIYPNPSNNQIFLKGDDSEIMNYQILTVDGKLLVESEYSQGMPMSIDQLPKGYYFLILSNKSGDKMQTSFVKE